MMNFLIHAAMIYLAIGATFALLRAVFKDVGFVKSCLELIDIEPTFGALVAEYGRAALDDALNWPAIILMFAMIYLERRHDA